jgi:hypothetical protein
MDRFVRGSRRSSMAFDHEPITAPLPWGPLWQQKVL